MRENKLLRIRSVRRLLTEWLYRREPLRQPGDRLATRSEVAEHYEALEVSRDKITEKITELRETGMLGKIDRVLTPAATGALAAVHDDEFGVKNVDNLLVSGETSWLDALVSDAQKVSFTDSWSQLKTAEPDDPELRRACIDLSRKLRLFVRNQHRNQWLAAVTEHRLVYLAESVDNSLRPRILERIRQYFGK